MPVFTLNPYQNKLAERGITADRNYKQIWQLVQKTNARNIIIVHKKIPMDCETPANYQGCFHFDTREMDLPLNPEFPYEMVFYHELCHSMGVYGEEDARYCAYKIINNK